MRQVLCEVDSVRKLPERSPHGRNPLPKEHGACSQEVPQQANNKEIGRHPRVRGWAGGVVRYVGQLLKGYGLWAEDTVEEESLSGTTLSTLILLGE